MHATIYGERTLTDLDFARLGKLLGRELPPHLAELLASAEVTSSRAVPSDVVTMYSRVELVDVHTLRRQTLTVCYPGDAEPTAGFISVLSPVGSSLLGLKVGDIARWQSPNGNDCAAEVTAILFQPEATGDYQK
ncbi:GreA/GreB family elongation factor [Variovorax sp. J22R133]|uniref:GreA/GreB family elongation factor n=1 Tax=Variovorax brevis TaxID=3053503 RepID=UPI00257579CA|nr:GreA/GreB family elongation factor [Variovorax sp. J22R133]MDM0116322.1 GreA/GreB family elongation factor [Variovorax sp. J22R133]